LCRRPSRSSSGCLGNWAGARTPSRRLSQRAAPRRSPSSWGVGGRGAAEGGGAWLRVTRCGGWVEPEAAMRRVRGDVARETSCCAGSDAVSGPIGAEAYSTAEIADLGLSLGASLGCGNPTMLAQLHAGEVVLDLGSGAGLDVLLSAGRVSPGGHAYGIDMTDEMLALANENKARAGVENATFLKGTLEAIPLAPRSVDVVISNCVINLAADKAAVLKEAFRVLK